MQNEEDRLELLEKAHQLIESIENNDDETAGDLLNTMSVVREKSLFKEVGQLTRQLHDSLASFALDDQLTELTDKEIPDAKERLNYVIEMTNEAANKTLNAIDEVIPVTNEMQRQSEELSKKWNKFMSRDLSLDEFKKMSGEISVFLDASCKNSKFVHEKANEIMLAQGFQDLTGQIIKKVIGLVQNVEDSLVELVKFSGPVETGSAINKEEKGKLEGPAVPGVVVEGAVNSQDEVDDLLSSLGF
ncbi:MAG: protein phosphatase CheZ [Cycloclasticus sp.]|nr:protein phosphatase CheZ [Cycloclasticus sp.]